MNILFKIVHDVSFFAWDFGVTVINILIPSISEGRVVPEGHPGFKGQWPEYIPPEEGDSRCSCPALNALANHGILPRDGKNIQFKELGKAIRSTYNFSSTFCYFVPHYAAEMLGKKYGTDKIDLHELDLHNGIEHDASLIREDSAIQPDQSKPQVEYINQLLSYASGKDNYTNDDILTAQDLSRFSSKRRADARGYNKNFTLSFIHKIFGSTNASTMLTVFGGRVKDLKIWLLEERFPDGWETKLRQPLGITFATFNLTIFRVELGINEKKYLLDKQVAEEAAAKTSQGDDSTSTGGAAEEVSQSNKLVDVE